MPQLSAAWLDLWHTEWIPSKEERLTLLRLVKKSSETVTTVLWMLEVAQGQSNINSDENYIFLSRIDGIKLTIIKLKKRAAYSWSLKKS